MGSPLGPVFANIFLDIVENGGRYPNKLGYYCRYIDDKLTVSDYSINKQKILNNIKKIHSAIKFTSEEDYDNSLAFLNVILSRKIDDSIKRNPFRKDTDRVDSSEVA